MNAVDDASWAKTTSGSWLLDTGAAVSMISHKEAAELGVTYIAETRGYESSAFDRSIERSGNL